MRVLVVDDDPIVTDVVVRSLSQQHYAVDTAADGVSGWECAESATYDLMVIDIRLPKLNGIALCQKIRDRGCTTPILLMTAQTDSEDRVRGLDSGADDYLAKPFDLAELQARVRALLRRGSVTPSSLLTIGALQLDPRSCQVTYAEKLLPLTPKEYSLLELFLRNPARVFSCGDMIEHLWTFDDPPQEESVKSHIKGLRQKLKTVGAADWIENVYGLGYRLREGVQNQEQAYSQAVAQLWEQHRGLMEERFTVLQTAVTTESLSVELKQSAASAAHKLAGVLGMFDRPEGTQIARQLEQLFEGQTDLAVARSLVQQLGTLLDLPQSVEIKTPAISLDSSSSQNWGVGGANLRSWRVLAVDDDPIILATLKQILEPWGIGVTGIDNPLQFWSTLPSVNPDLLILDVEMPHLNGIALCQAIRANPNWQGLPIVFLTAHQESATVQQIFAAGADDYVVKPVVGQELLARMTNRLERIRLLQTLSTKDSITGLPNQFNSSQAIEAQLRNHQSACFAIFYLPTLRQINIHQGHSVGNQVLKQTAQVLQSKFCNGETIGYWRNGEFAISTPCNSEGPASVQTTKATMQQQLAESITVLQQTWQVEYRYAVVNYPDQGLNLRSLYQSATLSLEGQTDE